MYPTHRLETPPPASRFRRPWSPEPFDPNPRGGLGDYQLGGTIQQQGRRELSDVSVEALDLADYARTLQTNELRTREVVTFQPYDSYPPSPSAIRPLLSCDSFAPTPPLSPSPSSSQSYSTHSPGRGHRGQHRPFSFPVPHVSVQSHPTYSNHSNVAPTYATDGILRTPPAGPDAEIDIAQFPRFTRHWYDSGPTDPTYGQPRLDADIFDPTYSPYKSKALSPESTPYTPPYLSSQASYSSRDIGAVPWGKSSAEGPPIDAEVKEERVRMLEREFGKDAGQEEENLVGSVDSNGKLITEGPKKRVATRWTQVLFALLAAVSSIYAALIIKNPTPPPPSGKPPAYILYILSVITFFLSSYMFLIYPSCCARRKRKALETPFTQGPTGMMVLPVSGAHGDKKKKKKGKNGKNGGEGVQVNLIVDPRMFGNNLHDEEEDEDKSETESSVPGTYPGSGRSRSRRQRHRRRSVFDGLALEAQWKHARKILKWGMLVDVVMLIAWGAEFVYILIGQRCPPGLFNGWCDAYNVASAAACLLCFFFGLSIFFDIKDLHASNASPRTRTRRY